MARARQRLRVRPDRARLFGGARILAAPSLGRDHRDRRLVRLGDPDVQGRRRRLPLRSK